MRCPQCGHEAITLSHWMRGRNAFRHQCPGCGIYLRASKATWIGLGVTLLVTLAVVAVAIAMFDVDVGRGNPIRYALILGPAIVGAIVTYLVGGYAPMDRGGGHEQ